MVVFIGLEHANHFVMLCNFTDQIQNSVTHDFIEFT